MADIQFHHVKKTYDTGVTVVPDLNLEIHDQEFVVLVGPSGCGKSTTLRMIAGLEEITDGDLMIGGKKVNDIAPKDRDIAMVFQNYALYPHMTVYKNMAFGLELRKTPKSVIDEKVRWAAEVLNLTDYLDRKPKALSGGQRQRVALGRAMVRDPAVFLLDEPLSNLDAKLRTQMRTELTQLHKKLNTTFVYVTHDQTEAMTMGDRIAVMKDGILQQFDTPQNLYSFPRNLFVAGFIGSPQMNFIHAQVEYSGEEIRVVFGGFSIPVPTGKCGNSLNDYVGKTVIVGIRPEDMHAEDIFLAASDHSKVRFEVELAELMGAEIYLYGKCGGEKMTARVPARTKAKSGDSIELAIDCNHIHIFDEESEEIICQ